MISRFFVDAKGEINHIRRGQCGRPEQDLVAVAGYLWAMQPTCNG
jgi:hypothetical protein